MSIVALIVCQNAEPDLQNPNQKSIHFIQDATGKYKFFACTSYVDLKMGILNQAAFEQLVPGEIYKMTLERLDS